MREVKQTCTQLGHDVDEFHKKALSLGAINDNLIENINRSDTTNRDTFHTILHTVLPGIILVLGYTFLISGLEVVTPGSDYTELDIKFQCECRNNPENPKKINCKTKNWFQKFWNNLF